MTSPARRAGPRAQFALFAALFAAPLCVLAQTAPIATETCASSPAEQPRWEAGVLLAALTIPDYPAADESRHLLLPVPYFIYRGRVLRADDSGSRLRRRLAPNLEIDISGGGSLSSDASDTEARRGMPDLDYLVELGPNLRLSYPGPHPKSLIVVNLPLRGVVSVGSGLDWQGMRFAPELAYVNERFLDGRLALNVSLVSEFASERLQRYFYEVDPVYATPERLAYRASAGYLGSSLGARAWYSFTPSLRGLISVRWYNHDGAANEDSPLFRRANGYSATIGLAWSFLRSRERAAED